MYMTPNWNSSLGWNFWPISKHNEIHRWKLFSTIKIYKNVIFELQIYHVFLWENNQITSEILCSLINHSICFCIIILAWIKSCSKSHMTEQLKFCNSAWNSCDLVGIDFYSTITMKPPFTIECYAIMTHLLSIRATTASQIINNRYTTRLQWKWWCQNPYKVKLQ